MRFPPLSERQIDILRTMEGNGWVTPMEIGAHSRSHHSVTLRGLIKRGLVEAEQRRARGHIKNPFSTRGSLHYRITEDGIRELKSYERNSRRSNTPT